MIRKTFNQTLKPLLPLLAGMTFVTLCHGQEVIVTTQNPQGWTFGVEGQSSSKPTSASWLLGSLNGFPQLGKGSLWFYSGNADGIAYADFNGLKDVSLDSVTRLGYSTYTSNDSNGREDINMAAEFQLHLKVPDVPAGGIILNHPPGLFGAIARGNWKTRNILSEKWICNKSDSSDRRTLSQWLDIYPNATISKIRIMAGANSSPRTFAGWTLGVDNVIIGTGLTQSATYNFEPGAPGQDKTKQTGVSRTGSPTVSVTVVNPIVIAFPTYYIADGEPTGQIPTREESVEPEPTPKEPEKEPKPAPKVEPYLRDDGIFVPLLFLGNTTLQKVLYQPDSDGNPVKGIADGSTVSISNGGAFLFGGVPFYIPEGKNNVWDAGVFQDDLVHKLVVKANLKGVIQIHTMINTTYANGKRDTSFVELRGTKGAFYRRELVINYDIRDMRTSSFSKIEPPSQVVWSRLLAPTQGKDWQMFLDSQIIEVPTEFENQELESVTFVDKGKHKGQRFFVSGVTAKVKTAK